jgi:hypothetical protein
MKVMMLDLETNVPVVSIDCNNVNDGITGIREYLNRTSVGDSCDENPIFCEKDGKMERIGIALYFGDYYGIEICYLLI